MAAADPEKLLAQALDLISVDLNHLEADAKAGKLHHQDAQTVTRYVGILSDVLARQEASRSDQRRGLGDLSTEQLLEKARELGIGLGPDKDGGR